MHNNYKTNIEKFKNMDERTIKDRIRGSLIGGAVGDALGYPVEFMSSTGVYKKNMGRMV